MNDIRNRPQTVEEAVDRLLTEMNPDDRECIAAMKETDLALLHFSLGAHIRNAFGLWRGNDALLASCRKAAGNPDLHVDDAATVINTALWNLLHRKAT